MKIGFIGAGGTGKTTVMEIVAKRLDLQPLPSVVRAVFREFGAIESDQNSWSVEKRWELQRRIFERKVEQERENRHGIADRTILDHLMYCYIRAAEAITEEDSRQLESMVMSQLKLYDGLFFFPVGHFDPPGDGLRENGRAYRMLQHAVLKGLMATFSIGAVTVPAGTPESRADFVEREILWRMEEKREHSVVIPDPVAAVGATE